GGREGGGGTGAASLPPVATPRPPLRELELPDHRSGKELGPDHQAVLVDVEPGTVMRRALLVGRGGADERERAGDAGEKARHVFYAHGPDPIDHTLARDYFLCDV